MRTGEGGKLAAATRNAVVAFQADHVDRATMTGWTVLVVGRARVVEDKAELAELAKIALRSWVPAKRDHFIRIDAELVTGRRNGPGAQAA